MIADRWEELDDDYEDDETNQRLERLLNGEQFKTALGLGR